MVASINRSAICQQARRRGVPVVYYMSSRVFFVIFAVFVVCCPGCLKMEKKKIKEKAKRCCGDDFAIRQFYRLPTLLYLLHS
jgi:hypothetical protein